MSAEAFAYVAGGAGAESTMRANRDAFERWRIVPRVLRDVSIRDTSVELLGARIPAPVLLAPIGVLDMAHREADLAAARAAAAVGVPFVVSSQASRPMEACAAAMGDAPRWFQLYWSRDDGQVESFVERAAACGCSAIVLTLDTTLLGWRTRDLELGYLPFLRGRGIAQYRSDPAFQAALRGPPPDGPPPPRRRPTVAGLRTLLQLSRAHGGGLLRNLRTAEPVRAVRQFVGSYSRPSLTWDDLSFLRERTRLPILLKGILHPDDARRAIDAGMDGIIVSNHGGRQVDGAIASLDALPPVVDAVAGAVPVLMDGGVRGGADVFRAVALGARAVLLGRPYVYGLAVGGEAGVSDVIRNLLADFELTMALAGCATVAEIGPGALVPG
jgi:lactate 2-monooxygenase